MIMAQFIFKLSALGWGLMYKRHTVNIYLSESGFQCWISWSWIKDISLNRYLFMSLLHFRKKEEVYYINTLFIYRVIKIIATISQKSGLEKF